MANINTKTGIRYGVISGNNIDWESVEGDAEYIYPDCDCVEDDYDYTDFAELSEIIVDKPYLKMSYDPETNIAVVFFSERIVKCALCSPCYPNAGDLDSEDEDGYETYALLEEYIYD